VPATVTVKPGTWAEPTFCRGTVWLWPDAGSELSVLTSLEALGQFVDVCASRPLVAEVASDGVSVGGKFPAWHGRHDTRKSPSMAQFIATLTGDIDAHVERREFEHFRDATV
jgi:hypothetical protein